MEESTINVTYLDVGRRSGKLDISRQDFHRQQD